MSNFDVKQMWEQCLGIIRNNTPEREFTTWFGAIQPIEYSNGELILSAPSHFVVERIEADHLDLLRFAIQKIFGKGTKLEYRVLADKKNNLTVDVEATKRTVFKEELKKPEITNPNEKPVLRPLDPRLNPNYNFENFIVGGCNKLPRSAGEAIAERPADTAFNPLFLYGPPGVGKTHLANAIGIKIKERYPEKRVLYVAAHEFQVQYTDSVRNNTFNNFINFYQSIDVLILDDVQEFASASLVKTQDTFFHIFNYLHQNRKQLILTCDRPPVKLQGMTDRLLSRFKWGLLAEISRPDVALRKEVIHSKVHRDGLHFSEEVINYIAENVDESVRDLEGIITSLMARAAVFNRDPDLTMAENLVHQIATLSNKPITVDDIITKVCSYYNIEPKEIQTPSRKQKVVQIRQIAMYLSQKYTDTSLSRIGTMIGKRNHATVLHATKIISGLLENDKQLQKDMQEIEALVKQR